MPAPARAIDKPQPTPHSRHQSPRCDVAQKEVSIPWWKKLSVRSTARHFEKRPSHHQDHALRLASTGDAESDRCDVPDVALNQTLARSRHISRPRSPWTHLG